MSETPETPAQPEPAAEPQTGRIGVDSWVAEAEGRRARGLDAVLGRGWERTPNVVKLLVFVGIASSFPFWTGSEADVFNLGLFTLLYAALGLGLNVVVGFAGLLDLGYVAFYGIGAYMYSELSSPEHGTHWPAEVTIPIAMASAALVGVVLGFSARRLLGDYLAIVTLFFAQAFVFFTGITNPHNLTGGANGIPQVDQLKFFGYSLKSDTTRGTTERLFFFLLIVVTLLVIALHFANQSRTGRAWRALREDPLAAEAMSIPVNRLKILAFVFGASIAGLCGAIYAAILGATGSSYFNVGVLVIIYAVVILGGFGSIAGVIVGAVLINCFYQFMVPSNDHPEVKRWLFYGTIILLVTRLKPWIRPVIVLAGTIAFGLATHAIVDAWTANSWTSGAPQSGGKWVAEWAVIPRVSHQSFNNYLYIGLVVAMIAAVTLKGWWRTFALIPTLYLVVLVWENLLTQNGGVTAYLLFGAMLIGLMAIRPQGLLGTARVEIV